MATYTAWRHVHLQRGVRHVACPNGDTLVSDSGNNNRVVEVNPADQIVWQYVTNTDPASNPDPVPTRAVRLRNGDHPDQ